MKNMTIGRNIDMEIRIGRL
uniref:Uncharacterized protein n=1 Tax=Arundo donax TaxID=35708 RepID=A0A0A9C7N2_ARUDO